MNFHDQAKVFLGILNRPDHNYFLGENEGEVKSDRISTEPKHDFPKRFNDMTHKLTHDVVVAKLKGPVTVEWIEQTKDSGHFLIKSA